MAYMLTTTDNPYNPFTDYDEWLAFDTRQGYHSNSLLARVANISDELAESDVRQEIQFAIEEIVTENLSGVHTKVEDKRTSS